MNLPSSVQENEFAFLKYEFAFLKYEFAFLKYEFAFLKYEFAFWHPKKKQFAFREFLKSNLPFLKTHLPSNV